MRERTGATRAHKRRLYTMVKDLREIVPEGPICSTVDIAVSKPRKKAKNQPRQKEWNG